MKTGEVEIVPSVTLRDGSSMPIVGLGTSNLEERTQDALLWALTAGYRHVDTAEAYGNERDVGDAITKSSVPRRDIYIVTKVAGGDQGYDATMRAIEGSLDRLGVSAVDQYLIHWPHPDTRVREETWRALEALRSENMETSIGVSNYYIDELQEMETYMREAPTVNQIECHPLYYPEETIAYCRERGIAVTAYSPIARMRHTHEPAFQEIASAHNKSVPQILLKWNIQHGHAVIPCSRNKEHIEENHAVFDFELSDKEMRRLDGLNRRESVA